MTMSLQRDPDSPAPASQEDFGDRDDPVRSRADVILVDDRWNGIAGLPAFLSRCAATTLKRGGAKLGAASVTIALSNDAEVRALNRQYRGKDKSTNVLSFPQPDFPQAEDEADDVPSLGDIVLAFETVEREAAEEGKPFTHHAAHLAVHGTLHLLGFDHEDDEEAGAMEDMETLILAEFDIPNPYADETPRRETASPQIR